MDFPKKQAQRLIPLHLLDYATQLQISHPDPTESWGGSGGTYTGGDGITISSDNVISVDDTIAKKSEIPSRVKSPFLGVRQTTDGTVLFSETGQDDDYYSVYHVTEPVKVNLRALNTKFGNGLTSSYNTSTRALDVAVDTTTVALKTDIPSLDGYATQTWVQNQGYSTFSGSYNDLLDKPTLATVATSGSYNDLLDKPTIPDTTNLVTTNTDQTISGTKTFKDGALKVENTLNCRTMTYDGFGFFDLEVKNQGTIEKIIFELPTYKTKGTEDAPTQYTLATTDDIPNSDNFVTLDTDQTISGAKTFQGGPICSSLGGAYTMQPLGVGVLRCNDVNSTKQKDFSLPIEKSGTEYTLATTDDIHNPTITFTQGGTTKGTITLNQSGDQTIEFDGGGSSGGGKLYLHKITIKKNIIYNESGSSIGDSLYLFNSIVTSSNQPMSLATYKAYFTSNYLGANYGCATSGKAYIDGGNSSIISINFNNNFAGINYFRFKNSSSINSFIKVKFDSVDGFEDTVTEV